MKWFKKKLESNPLNSEKRRLDTELQEIEKRIQEAEAARKKIRSPVPSLLLMQRSPLSAQMHPIILTPFPEPRNQLPVRD